MKIKELRIHFKGLNSAQKKEFILKLRKQLEGSTSAKYRDFLSECTQAYNQELKEKKAAQADRKEDISSELFAKAISSMLKGSQSDKPIDPSSRLVGHWQGDSQEDYYIFKEDGTLETNNTPTQEPLQGYYKFNQEGILQIEPHEILAIKNLTVSITNTFLVINYENGKSKEYKRIK